MAELGLPVDAWFVTLHARGEAADASLGENRRTGRNAPILDYQDAIARISDAGGWVVRIGGDNTTRLPPMEHVIDYAHSPDKSDWLDIFLISQCRFFLGVNSGPIWAAMTFGVPTLLTNWSPIGIQPHASTSVMLPRLIRADIDGQLLSFAKQLEPPTVHSEAPHRLEQAGFAIVENTPEEIAVATEEMIQRTTGRYAAPAGDRDRQKRFRELVTAAGIIGRCEVASAFLSEHADLL
jgi:putative glycosyltransferase (TIGR04372 family)